MAFSDAANELADRLMEKAEQLDKRAVDLVLLAIAGRRHARAVDAAHGEIRARAIGDMAEWNRKAEEALAGHPAPSRRL